MAQRIGGNRRKTRSKLKKPIRGKGKISLKQFFQSFNAGDKVCLKANSSYQDGMYHPRLHGKVGKILGLQGACYNVEIQDQNKIKKVIVHPVHLRGF